MDATEWLKGATLDSLDKVVRRVARRSQRAHDALCAEAVAQYEEGLTGKSLDRIHEAESDGGLMMPMLDMEHMSRDRRDLSHDLKHDYTLGDAIEILHGCVADSGATLIGGYIAESVIAEAQDLADKLEQASPAPWEGEHATDE